MNISAKFQLYGPYSFWGVDFLNIFHKCNILAAMTTKEIRFGQFYSFGRELLNKHFWKTFAKIPAMRQQ